MAVYIVALDSGTHASNTAAENAITGAGATISQTYNFNLTYKIEATPEQLAAISGVSASSLEADTLVANVAYSTDHLKHLSNDVGSGLSTAYNPLYTGNDSQIYLLDTGVNVNHTEFANANVINLHSMFSDGSGGYITADETGHGTAIASLINGENIGVSPKANVLSVKVMNASTYSGTVGSMIEAMNVVLTHHQLSTPSKVKTVCIPWTTSKNSLIDSKLQELESHNMMVVCSAGNDADDTDNYSPAGLDQVMTVGAYNSSWVVGGFGANATWSGGSAGSNLGEEVDIYALGSNVSIADKSVNTGYLSSYGTSAATAIIAGLSAQYIEAYPGATATQIKSYMVSEGAVSGRGANISFDSALITSTGANADSLSKSIGVSPQVSDVSLSTLPSGLVLSVQNGQSGNVDVGLNVGASNVSVLAFSPLPPFVTFDTSTGIVVADTTSNMGNVTVPGKYHFAVRGEVGGVTKVEEYTVGVYTTAETELDSANEYYFDGEAGYDQVVQFNSTKE
jgi:subtilisin family serine protease